MLISQKKGTASKHKKEKKEKQKTQTRPRHIKSHIKYASCPFDL